MGLLWMYDKEAAKPSNQPRYVQTQQFQGKLQAKTS